MHVGSPQERQEVSGGTLRSHPGASGGIDCLSGGGLYIPVFCLPQFYWVCSAVPRLWSLNALCTVVTISLR